MNPSIPLDEESRLDDETQNRIGKVFCTDRTLVSLPDKDELLLCLRLNLIHKHRQKLPKRYLTQTRCFSLQRSSDYENR
jgi:hypothetical protein